MAPRRAPAGDAGFDELDFGDWRGRSFAALAGDPRWAHFNTARGTGAIPGGETAAAVLDRAGAALARLTGLGSPVLAVTHADVIRTVVAAAIGLAPDLMLRLEVPTASATVLLWETPPRLRALAWRPGPPIP
jgi:probable phosphoglycerate mutase